ncbi:MAG: glutamate--tRNA ligase [bacterium]|nr:glutamate--tRNA ligase [bacterium]
MNERPVRVRFAPSPTGYLHIGGARTALFNWLVARKSSGTLVLRIEDTDRARHVEDSLEKILADLRWLGLEWDEGPEVGGDVGPYFQSERLAIYQDHLDRLLAEGKAYYAMETPEELAAMRERALAERQVLRYPRPDPLPTVAEGEAARKQGRPVVVRFLMPGEDVAIEDEILGRVELAGSELDDFVIQKADGWPTYHFACVVDDALMEISHVLRGQEHLINTPKHVTLQRALGFSPPVYAHLPIIFNMSGGKMSKRDKEKALQRGETPPEIDVHDFRAAGYLPEALVNFISLLGWATGDDTEQMTLKETAERFSIGAVNKSSAKFDRAKLLAFNTDWAARLPAERLLEVFKDFLSVNQSPLLPQGDETLAHLLQVCAGLRTFRDVETKTAPLYADDQDIVYVPKAVKKTLAKSDGRGFSRLESVLPCLTDLTDWTTAELERCIEAFCTAHEFKLGEVAQPIRVAVTGNTVSPPIYDTLALLGKDGTINRIRRALTLREQA